MPVICNPCAGESPKSGCDFCVAQALEKIGEIKNGKIHCRCYAANHNRELIGITPPFTQEEQTKIESLRKIEESKVIKKRSFHYDYWSDDVLLELFNWLCSRLKKRVSLLFKTREVMTE